jgi:multimeric flavodoxin WrbA
VRILAINGSPRGARGNTARIIEPFLEGAREAGAEAEVITLRDKDINHCLGCFNCWIKTPGVCVHKDDMPNLLEKIVAADVLVFGTPLYIFTFSGLMSPIVV